MQFAAVLSCRSSFAASCFLRFGHDSLGRFTHTLFQLVVSQNQLKQEKDKQ
eukprot:m.49557 g.49557  ORF g.49557 m.49557 type:complete len:51 (-) comp12481_c0_seq1:99-251(-)